MTRTRDHFPVTYFAKQDRTTDALFYINARKVVHIDTGAINALTAQFAQLLPQGGVYLDLMSSWRSHLPDSLKPKRVVGLGMNAEEMRDNPVLGKYVTHDLNDNPTLPFEDGSFDAAFCTVSVQYLTQPVEVFHDVARVLKPGAPFVVSFSNRCFPSKAVAVWTNTSDSQHLALVARYFEAAGLWTEITTWQRVGRFNGDPLFIVHAKRHALV